MKVRSNLIPQKHTPKGFTLLEIVIVLGIIAIILGGSITFLGRMGESAKLQQVTSDFNTLSSAIKMYKLNAGTFPTTSQGLEALVSKPSSTPVPKRWTQVATQVPVDPWQQPYKYRFPGRKDPSEFEIYTVGKDGQEGTDDDMSSQD